MSNIKGGIKRPMTRYAPDVSNWSLNDRPVLNIRHEWLMGLIERRQDSVEAEGESLLSIRPINHSS